MTSPEVAEAGSNSPVPALTGAAIPLRSTAPDNCLPNSQRLAAIFSRAQVIGAGEATHGSQQFFSFKDCLFRYLVDNQGFGTFALETDWAGGLRINAYVLSGRGDIRKIMRQEFQGVMQLWNNREYLSLIEWMRAYNAEHTSKVQFMGDDIELASTQMFDAVQRYVDDHYPSLRSLFTQLYHGQRPTGNVGTAIHEYRTRPLRERRDMAARAERAFELLSAQQAGTDPQEYAWILQQARVIAQVAHFEASDFNSTEGHTQGDLYRDQAMADNVLWWRQFTSSKILLSADNGHVGYLSGSSLYPRTQGSFFRQQLGAAYIAIRATFDSGSLTLSTGTRTGSNASRSGLQASLQTSTRSTRFRIPSTCWTCKPCHRRVVSGWTGPGPAGTSAPPFPRRGRCQTRRL